MVLAATLCSMSVTKHSGPTPPFLKPNGMWAVIHFSKGVSTEYGEYRAVQDAQSAYEKLAASWLANDPVYIVPAENR